MLTLKQRYAQHMEYEQIGGVGYAYVEPFPRETEIALVHGVYIPVDQQRKGIGSRQHAERLNLIKDAGFNYAMCVAYNQNSRQIAILLKNGWEKIRQLEFHSIWFKDLRDSEGAIDVEPE